MELQSRLDAALLASVPVNGRADRSSARSRASFLLNEGTYRKSDMLAGDKPAT